MKRIILFFFIGSFISCPTFAAVEWKENTSLLPPYCKDIVAKKWPGKWRNIFGETTIHMHHYCEGIYSEMKAKTDYSEREFWLNRVIVQMRYVSGACKPESCVLYPELHTRWGWALGEQGNVGDAIQHFQMAIRVKSKYVPAYLRLAELYVKLNQTEEARKILETGLSASPESRSLKRRIRKLEKSQ